MILNGGFIVEKNIYLVMFEDGITINVEADSFKCVYHEDYEDLSFEGAPDELYIDWDRVLYVHKVWYNVSEEERDSLC